MASDCQHSHALPIQQGTRADSQGPADFPLNSSVLHPPRSSGKDSRDVFVLNLGLVRSESLSGGILGSTYAAATGKYRAMSVLSSKADITNQPADVR